jgi:hypothetical protein
VDYNLGPGRPGAKTGLGWRKKWGRKNPVWPCQKLGCNPLTFVFFFTKITLFWFKKKRIDLDDLVIRSKSWTRVLDRAGHQVGSENYGLDHGFLITFSFSMPNHLFQYTFVKTTI